MRLFFEDRQLGVLEGLPIYEVLTPHFWMNNLFLLQLLLQKALRKFLNIFRKNWVLGTMLIFGKMLENLLENCKKYGFNSFLTTFLEFLLTPHFRDFFLNSTKSGSPLQYSCHQCYITLHITKTNRVKLRGLCWICC